MSFIKELLSNRNFNYYLEETRQAPNLIGWRVLALQFIQNRVERDPRKFLDSPKVFQEESEKLVTLMNELDSTDIKVRAIYDTIVGHLDTLEKAAEWGLPPMSLSEAKDQLKGVCLYLQEIDPRASGLKEARVVLEREAMSSGIRGFSFHYLFFEFKKVVEDLKRERLAWNFPYLGFLEGRDDFLARAAEFGFQGRSLLHTLPLMKQVRLLLSGLGGASEPLKSAAAFVRRVAKLGGVALGEAPPEKVPTFIPEAMHGLQSALKEFDLKMKLAKGLTFLEEELEGSTLVQFRVKVMVFVRGTDSLEEYGKVCDAFFAEVSELGFNTQTDIFELYSQVQGHLEQFSCKNFTELREVYQGMACELGFPSEQVEVAVSYVGKLVLSSVDLEEMLPREDLLFTSDKLALFRCEELPEVPSPHTAKIPIEMRGACRRVHGYLLRRFQSWGIILDPFRIEEQLETLVACLYAQHKPGCTFKQNLLALAQYRGPSAFLYLTMKELE